MGEGVGGVLLSGEVPSAGSPDEGSWQVLRRLRGRGSGPRGARVRLGERVAAEMKSHSLRDVI